MCVIVAKNKDARIPTIEELKNCFDRNGDGSGFMYVDNGKVVIDKGYMTFKSFKKHFNKLCKKYDNFNNKSLVIHFRIGTAGANSPENTHPYIITSDEKKLHNTYMRSDLGVAHNGIIYDYNPRFDEKGTNDTQEFIKKYLTPLKENYKYFYKNKYILDGIKDITNSKFALLDNEENIYYIGDFINFDGVMYSNESYKKLSFNNSLYKWNSKDYDDYESCNNIKNYNFDEEYAKIKDNEEEDLWLDIIKIEEGWYIETAVGDWWLNREKNLYYDFDKMQVLKKIGEEYQVLFNQAVIFDENYEEIY